MPNVLFTDPVLTYCPRHISFGGKKILNIEFLRLNVKETKMFQCNKTIQLEFFIQLSKSVFWMQECYSALRSSSKFVGIWSRIEMEIVHVP